MQVGIVDGHHILAVSGLHAVVPARKRSRDVADLLFRFSNHIPLMGLGDEISSKHVAYSLPGSWPQAASHCDVDGRHLNVVGVEAMVKWRIGRTGQRGERRFVQARLTLASAVKWPFRLRCGRKGAIRESASSNSSWRRQAR